MTVAKARKILGKMAEGMSDEQVTLMTSQIKQFTDYCVEIIGNRIKKEGAYTFCGVK